MTQPLSFQISAAVAALGLCLACGDDSSTPGMETAGAAGSPTAGSPPVGTGSWVTGSTYLLTTTEKDWAEPTGIGSEIGAYVPQFAVSITSDGMGSVGVRLGTAAGNVQELCAPTLDVTSGPGPYPGFSVGPVDLPLHLKYVEPGTGAVKAVVHSTAYGLTLTNIMPEDGDRNNGILTAVMDLREVYPMFQQLSTDPTLMMVKDALASFGVVLSACPQDGAVECIALKADYLQAVPTQVQLQPVDATAPTLAECAPTHVTP